MLGIRGTQLDSTPGDLSVLRICCPNCGARHAVRLCPEQSTPSAQEGQPRSGNQSLDFILMRDEHLTNQAQATRLVENHQPRALDMLDVDDEREPPNPRALVMPRRLLNLAAAFGFNTNEYRASIMPNRPRWCLESDVMCNSGYVVVH